MSKGKKKERTEERPTVALDWENLLALLRGKTINVNGVSIIGFSTIDADDLDVAERCLDEFNDKVDAVRYEDEDEDDEDFDDDDLYEEEEEEEEGDDDED